MGSEVNNERARNAEELRNMQDTYRKKKQEVKQQGEQDLETTRQDYAGKIANEKRESAAVINHLKEDTRERTDQMKDFTEKKGDLRAQSLRSTYQLRTECLKKPA